MGKVTAPFFGFGASGAIAKAIVYFPWKGINAVRQYVVPANPNTTLQAAQRTRVTDAVAEWHDAAYNATDFTAWNRLANLLAKAMSGFNRMVKEYVDQDILGNVWTRIRQVETFDISNTSFWVQVTKVSGGLTPTIRWGTSPTNMPNSAAMVDATGNIWRYTLAGLIANTLYYFTVDVGASGATWGRIGIYAHRTTA